MPSAALDAATDVAQASQAVVDHLAGRGWPLPSVYLARGDRLRLQAQHGYRQVFDGVPSEAGLLGRAFRTGEPVLLPDVRMDPAYLNAGGPGVRAAACVPVRCWGSVVGVLNVESHDLLADDDVVGLLTCAEAFGVALERLGHVRVESPAQRLARHTVRLGGLVEEGDIAAQVVTAACDVADLDSAALLVQDARGQFVAVEAAGPLADLLGLAEAEAVAALHDLVAAGQSCYTLATTGLTHPVIGALLSRGAGALMAIGLNIGPTRRGLLLLADRRPVAPATVVVELLEMLSAHAASCLRTVAALAELRNRAATDPLTGLGHHATFHEALARARDRREEVAVLLADVDGFKAINDTRGHQAGDRMLRETAAALSSALRRGDELFRIGGDEFAAILRVSAGDEALEAARRLRDAVLVAGEVTISIGVALPEPGESDQSVLARADEALYEVKAAGRDGVALLS